MKKYIILILLFAVNVSYSQNFRDSLLVELNISEPGRKIDILNNLVIQLRDEEPERAIIYGLQAIELAGDTDDENGLAKAYLETGRVFSMISKFEDAVEHYKKSLAIYTGLNDTKLIAEVQNQIGADFRKWGKFKEAVNYHEKALNLNQKMNDTLGISNNMTALGLDYLAMAKEDWKYFEDALEMLGNAKKWNEKYNFPASTANVLNLIGKTYLEWGKNDRALEYFKNALEKNREINDKDQTAASLNYIGKVNYNLGNYDKSIHNYKKALSIYREIDEPEGILETISNLSQVHLFLSDPSQWEYGDHKNPMRNLRKAYDYLSQYSEIKDSLYNEERIKAFTESVIEAKSIQNLQLKDENTKTKFENMQLKHESELQELELGRRRDQIIFLILGILLVIIIAIGLFNRYSTKKKWGREIEKKKNELESANKKLEELNEQKAEYLKIINSDLNRASEYVKSLLRPPLDDTYIKTKWKYVPSSQLGGDSFGYHWIDDDHFAVYLMDVSGHGVGSALHAVSALNMLRNENLPDTDFKEPAQVMKALNEMLPMEEYNGMFITMWYGVYNKKNKTMKYARAGHPPAVFFGDSGSYELIGEDNFVIGGDPEYEYTQSTFKIPEGSELYLYSDGAYEIEKAGGGMMRVKDLAQFFSEHRKGKENGEEMDELYEDLRHRNDKESLEDDFSVLKVRFKK